MGSACALITLFIVAVMAIYGYKMILESKPKKEGDTAFVSDQLRGFGLISLAGLIFAIGMIMCYSPALFGMGDKVSKMFAKYDL